MVIAAPLASVGIADHQKNEFIRGPKWRTRASPAGRARAVLVTFAFVVATGAVLVGGTIWLLGWAGAPSWVVALPWLAPTLGAVLWALARPTPAVATDDDDESWVGYAIRYVIVGEDQPRLAPVRAIAAVIFGAPVAWALGVFGLATLLGLF